MKGQYLAHFLNAATAGGFVKALERHFKVRDHLSFYQTKEGDKQVVRVIGAGIGDMVVLETYTCGFLGGIVVAYERVLDTKGV